MQHLGMDITPPAAPALEKLTEAAVESFDRVVNEGVLGPIANLLDGATAAARESAPTGHNLIGDIAGKLNPFNIAFENVGSNFVAPLPVMGRSRVLEMLPEQQQGVSLKGMEQFVDLSNLLKDTGVSTYAEAATDSIDISSLLQDKGIDTLGAQAPDEKVIAPSLFPVQVERGGMSLVKL